MISPCTLAYGGFLPIRLKKSTLHLAGEQDAHIPDEHAGKDIPFLPEPIQDCAGADQEAQLDDQLAKVEIFEGVAAGILPGDPVVIAVIIRLQGLDDVE